MIRLAVRRIYRAFPELDRFSDDECERFLQRVRREVGKVMLTFVAAAAAAIVGFIGSILIEALLLPVPSRMPLARRDGDFWSTIWMIVYLAAPPMIAFLASATTRDLLLRRHLKIAIEGKLNRYRCLKCKYSLIGQTPVGETVRCPECGCVQTFAMLGINHPSELQLAMEPQHAPDDETDEAERPDAPESRG